MMVEPRNWRKMVDLVGIEPTTFPASRDALKLLSVGLRSIPQWNDATSSS